MHIKKTLRFYTKDDRGYGSCQPKCHPEQGAKDPMAIVCDDKWQKGQREKRHLFKSKPHFCYRNQHSCQLNEGSESVVVDLFTVQQSSPDSRQMVVYMSVCVRMCPLFLSTSYRRPGNS